VETTTGPLGQGIGNSVGMAIASRWLAARYNRPGFELFDFDVYALCSDGDLMEGIGGEAASLAGHLRLANLCWLYDDNRITIEGSTALSFSENVPERFAAYGWNVVQVGDVNDLPSLRTALETFRKTADRPTLIVMHSVIGYGAPKKGGSHEAHGAPLGEEEVRLTKAAYGWPADEKFRVPGEAIEQFRQGVGRRGPRLTAHWTEQFTRYRKEYPEAAAELELIFQNRLPDGWDAEIQSYPADAKGMASRVSSGKALNQAAKRIPWMLGGSADLAPSNNSRLTFDGAGDFSAQEPGGRNFHFGIREHAMGAICNGLALCGLRPFAATFMVFADYMRPSIRLAALMRLPVLYIFTHDSIGVGEDGPTHQPVEQLASLRAIPNLLVVRPADANETAVAYKTVLSFGDRPAALALTRQNLPTLDRGELAPAEGLARGGYTLADASNRRPEVILIATGSEVALCVEAWRRLKAEGLAVRVVSMPCWELFDQQPEDYRHAVLPPEVEKRVAVEAGIRQGWDRYIGPRGKFIGLNGFGLSGPAGELMKYFGITVENIMAAAKDFTDM
jgi:transketolase